MSEPNHAPVAIVQQTDTTHMHPVVRAAMQGGTLDPSTLREILAVQREYEAGEAKKEFQRAMIALKRDMPSVVAKDTTVDFTSKRTGERTYYRHASLAGIMDVVVPALTQHGFSISWEPSTDKGQVTVTCKLTHSGGHTESATMSAPIDTSGSKSPAQGTMSTTTLLSRYTAASLLGIATADMPEPKGEHQPERSGDTAEPDLALKAAAKLTTEYGLTTEEAEAFIGKPVVEWTRADMKKIGAWAKQQRQSGDD